MILEIWALIDPATSTVCVKKWIMAPYNPADPVHFQSDYLVGENPVQGTLEIWTYDPSNPEDVAQAHRDMQ